MRLLIILFICTNLDGSDFLSQWEQLHKSCHGLFCIFESRVTTGLIKFSSAVVFPFDFTQGEQLYATKKCVKSPTYHNFISSPATQIVNMSCFPKISLTLSTLLYSYCIQGDKSIFNLYLEQ